MKRFLALAIAMISCTTAFSATGDIQYAASVKAYKSRCQQGDYVNAKFEELKDIEQINILAQKFGKPPFVSTCKNQQEKSQAKKSNTSISKQSEPQIPIGDTYENVDVRYRAELDIYSKKCLRGDYTIYRDEWPKDRSRINELAQQLGKPRFEPKSEKDCDANPSFYIGGDYHQKGEKSNIIHGGMEWTQSNSKLYWREGDRFCSQKSMTSNTGWRLPTFSELQDLYKSKFAEKNNWVLDWGWTTEQEGNSRAYYSDSYVGHKIMNLQNGGGSVSKGEDAFAICVRSSQNYENVADGGGYVPENTTHRPKTINSQRKESFEERSKRVLQESEDYQRSQQQVQDDNYSEEHIELQHEFRILDFDGLESSLPDCPKYGSKMDCYGREGETGEGYLGEFKNNTYDGFGTLSSKEKNVFIVGHFKNGELHGRVRYYPLNNIGDVHEGIFNAGVFKENITRSLPPTSSYQRKSTNSVGQNCDLAKAQAYLTPVPSGSFADSQRYADSAYASCMASLPMPAPPVAPRVITSPQVNVAPAPKNLNIYDNDGNFAGRIDNGGGFNSQGSVYDSNGNYNGHIDNGGGFNSNGSIYDANGNYQGKAR